jgi:hypothetical protein
MSLVFLANLLAKLTKILFRLNIQLIDNQINNLLKFKLNLVRFLRLFSRSSSLGAYFISTDLGKPSLF